ncbi:hypothetical protein niasHT_007471 [Heterodera trifolii]|uniref:Uncharacterized protein n=1 Tax=Heterodera trifolii TaxID=157864 RepID=A0ABD2LP90_9BILA
MIVRGWEETSENSPFFGDNCSNRCRYALAPWCVVCNSSFINCHASFRSLLFQLRTAIETGPRAKMQKHRLMDETDDEEHKEWTSEECVPGGPGGGGVATSDLFNSRQKKSLGVFCVWSRQTLGATKASLITTPQSTKSSRSQKYPLPRPELTHHTFTRSSSLSSPFLPSLPTDQEEEEEEKGHYEMEENDERHPPPHSPLPSDPHISLPSHPSAPSVLCVECFSHPTKFSNINSTTSSSSSS